MSKEERRRKREELTSAIPRGREGLGVGNSGLLVLEVGEGLLGSAAIDRVGGGEDLVLVAVGSRGVGVIQSPAAVLAGGGSGSGSGSGSSDNGRDGSEGRGETHLGCGGGYWGEREIFFC